MSYVFGVILTTLNPRFVSSLLSSLMFGDTIKIVCLDVCHSTSNSAMIVTSGKVGGCQSKKVLSERRSINFDDASTKEEDVFSNIFPL